MKYLNSIFEHHYSSSSIINSNFFEIDRKEYTRYLTTPDIYTFSKSEIDIINKFLDKKNVKYEWCRSILTFGEGGLWMEDAYDLSIEYEHVTLNTNGKSIDISAEPMDSIEIDNFSLFLNSPNSKFYINKCYDEWFIIECNFDGETKVKNFKCDQITGLLYFLEHQSFRF